MAFPGRQSAWPNDHHERVTIMFEEREILRQLAGQLATALGDGWRVDTSNDYTWQAHLHGPNGEVLIVSKANRSLLNFDRVSVSGSLWEAARFDNRMVSLPDGVDGGRITVARDRGPEVIAREIERRLLPKLRDDLAIAREKVAAARDAASGQAATAKRLGATQYNGSGKYYLNMRLRDGWVNLDNISHDGSSVSLDFSYVSPDLAARLLDVVQSEGWTE